MNQNYGYNNQPGMNMPPGQNQGPGTAQQIPVTGGMMNPQQTSQMQMMSGPRGAGTQEMNFMGSGNRTIGPRGSVSFMQGGPPQPQQPGMGGPMQASYGRPNMGGQMNQGGPGQMAQGGCQVKCKVDKCLKVT